MRQLRTQAIILSRTDYGEADRIITFLTPDHGKLKAIAKGVRKSKSKLAGGIELFSVSDISFIPGRGEISTVVSTRLTKHYGNIVKNLDRTNLGYELISRLNKATEDSPEADYFYLLEEAFAGLDNSDIGLQLIELWFNMQLLRLSGHTPNLRTDTDNKQLLSDKKYNFDFDRMRFALDEQGLFNSDSIKFLRLGFSPNKIQNLNRIKQSMQLTAQLQSLVRSVTNDFIRQ
jgi:DNA repair protein RecO (recombination protein O)